MASLLPGYEYDIFISYRQKDNKDGWVTSFVDSLKNELEAAFKEDISVYFDENPHDGLNEVHDVDGSLREKIKCLVFIPIVSHTYCDTNSFAWNKEFLPFLEFAESDPVGVDVPVANGNVIKRILPVRIHDIDAEDKSVFEQALGGVMRPIDFIYSEPGVNRPLLISDERAQNQNNTDYRNQVNKVSNAIRQILQSVQDKPSSSTSPVVKPGSEQPESSSADSISQKIRDRSMIRAGVNYLLLSAILWKVSGILFGNSLSMNILLVLTVLFPVAMILAWNYEIGPDGFVKIGKTDNPYTSKQRKPLTSNGFIISLILTLAILLFAFPSGKKSITNTSLSESSLAILPFRNNSGDTNYDHLGLGFASEIRSKLTATRQFDFITSEQATITFQNTTENPASIGEKLGVTHLLSGNYQLIENSIKINVELTDASNGNSLWSFPLDGNYSDLFSLQNQIANTVLSRFNATNSVNESFPTNNLEAYKFYLQGQEIRLKNRIVWEVMKAEDYFLKALALDPDFEEAQFSLITAYSYYYRNVPEDSRINPELLDSLINDMDKRHPGSIKVKLAKGYFEYVVNIDFDNARNLLEEVLESEPENFTALSILGAIEKRKLNIKKAIEYSTKEIKVNPLNVGAWSELWYVLRANGNIKDAKEAALKAFEINPNDPGLYRTAFELNQMHELPNYYKTEHKSRFTADSLYLARNFMELFEHVDTSELIPRTDISAHLRFDKHIQAYYQMLATWHMGRIQEAKMYAEICISGENRLAAGYVVDCLLILGRYNEIENFLESSMPTGGGVDKFNGVIIQIEKLRAMAASGKYSEATQKLAEINQSFPEYGGYQFLNHPLFDQLKSDYPPFTEAIDNLILPPLVSTESLLKY